MSVKTKIAVVGRTTSTVGRAVWTALFPDGVVKRRAVAPAALLAYHHVGYPILLWFLDRAQAVTAEDAVIRVGPRRPAPRVPHEETAPGDWTKAPLPRVALVIPAHNEADVIRTKVANALALDYPRDLLRIVVAADGCTDDTVDAARTAGADLVLDLPRGGKMAAQHATIAQLDEPIVAFSDANSYWAASALRELVAALAHPRVGYACGHVTFEKEGQEGSADNQEGLYWRYEMAIRERESRLASVTAGNGAIYAIKRAAYAAYAFDPVQGHDLAMPFQLVRAGWLAVDVRDATAVEKMVPTIDGEFRRKRRMMSHAWPIVLRAGLLDLRGQPHRYMLMLVSHRWLRYGAPLIHGWLAYSSVRAARQSRIARLLLLGQALLLAAAAKPDAAPAGPIRALARVARYYVATNAAIALGLKDHLVEGTEAAWTPPEGTR
ncbi:MAG: glycosyltransferase [Solirubrobacteraceae bacterium]|nr:glycosyltransferase [Solirubrobacteraceae bacterium]